ncbi:MAG: HAD-IA family hydrolase [Alteromonadaceae bacterium]|nr:HAD-IA family hydrolase [Alteromonadaceae bacterium]
MKTTLAFDVYGTLVDPMGMSRLLEQDAGEQAAAVAGLWREKQLEFSFRKGLMRVYEDFGVCTRQALRYAMAVHQLELSKAREDQLMAAYLSLPAFDDALPALQALRGQYPLFAFSNGSYSALEKVLGHNNLLEQFDGLVSSNTWDVIGARAAGLSAIWVKRDENRVFEDWGVEPTAVIQSLSQLPESLKALNT